jgi:hypothetical protein
MKVVDGGIFWYHRKGGEGGATNRGSPLAHGQVLLSTHQNIPVLSVWQLEALADHGRHYFIWNKLACVCVLLHLGAQCTSSLDLCADNVTSRDGRDAELRGDLVGKGALTHTRGSEEDETAWTGRGHCVVVLLREGRGSKICPPNEGGVVPNNHTVYAHTVSLC